MVSQPSDVLDYPYPTQPVPDLVNEILGVADLLSPTHLFAAGCDLVFGFNPFEEVVEWVTGDWAQVATAATALGQLAEYSVRFGHLTHDGVTTMLESWEGNAATSAGAWFNRFAIALDDLNEPLRSISGKYNAVAAGMQEMTAALTSILEQIGDLVISYVLKSAAAVASVETGVGPVLFQAWAAYDAFKAVTLWARALEIYGRAATLAQGVVGAISGSLAALPGMDHLALPTPYNHPGATA